MNNEKMITFKQKYLEVQEITIIFVIRFLDFANFSEIVIRGWLHPAPTSFFGSNNIVAFLTIRKNHSH
jgi:hypothetical protein